MMKNALLLVPLVLGVSVDAAVADASVPEKGIMSIYKTPALLELEFTTESQFSAEDIYHVEEATTLYLRALLTNDDSLRFLEEKNSVIDVSVNVQTQQVNGNEVSLGSEVDIIHYGDMGITDVAALLTFLVNRNNTDSSFIYLDHVIRTKASIELIQFDFVSESIPIATNLTTIAALDALKVSNGSEKTLLVVTTLLSITLFGMSAILIWVGGGWLVLRKKVQELLHIEEELTQFKMNIESKPTADTSEGDEEDQDSPSRGNGSTYFTNPSGILGMNKGYRPDMYGLGVKTPGKMGTSDLSLATPGSVMSEYSDTDRAPIGIMSMRKLVPPRQEDSDEESDSVGLNSLKKLEY